MYFLFKKVKINQPITLPQHLINKTWGNEKKTHQICPQVNDCARLKIECMSLICSTPPPMQVDSLTSAFNICLLTEEDKQG